MRLLVALSLALAVEACSGGAPSVVPTSPTQARPPDATFTVSGVVFGPRGTPLEGARVGIAGQQGTTDVDGYYSLPGVRGSYGGAFAAKEGFAPAREILTVDRDMRFDFRLGPSAAIYTLSGVVSEETPRGPVPIEGVRMSAYSCEDTPAIPPFFPAGSCGFAFISQATTTDKNGFYRFSGLYAGKVNHLSAEKKGFDDPRVDEDAAEGSGQEGKGSEVVINGDTRIDLQLVRR